MPSDVKRLLKSVFICHLYVVFGEVFIQIYHRVLMLVVFLLLSFESSLYILNVSPFLDIWFLSIFFQSMTCVFILKGIFQRAKVFFFFMKYDLSVFFFIYWNCILTIIAKKSLPNTRFSPRFPSRSFIVLGLHLGIWPVLS